jgi:N utilization substance protein B
MSSSRHLGRVITLQTLFAYEFHGGDPEGILEYIAREFEGKISDLSFAYELLNGVLHHEDFIRTLVTKHAPAWPYDKIAPVDRAVLEIAIFEMEYSKDVPKIVAIDEAIELAKTFGNENSPKFINGVLNAILESKRSTKETSA